jgi:hypothetical protein
MIAKNLPTSTNQHIFKSKIAKQSFMSFTGEYSRHPFSSPITALHRKQTETEKERSKKIPARIPLKRFHEINA